MRLIEFIDAIEGTKIYINPEDVSALEARKDPSPYTLLWRRNGDYPLRISGSPQDVAEKLQEPA